MRGEAVTLTAEHDDGEHDHGDHREHDGGEHGDGDTVTAHREPQKPPPIPRLRWPPNGCGVATAAHNDAEAARTAAARCGVCAGGEDAQHDFRAAAHLQLP